MKERIPLIVNKENISLMTLISCDKLRIRLRPIKFIIDTGSSESYLSQMDVSKLQISVDNKKSMGKLNLGGSQYDALPLPEFKFYILKEDRKVIEKEDIILKALEGTTSSINKLQLSERIPSILGLDFLKNQKCSLHVFMAESMAYMELE